MSRKMVISEEWFSELARTEARNTSSFARLEEVFARRMDHDAALVVAGELDEDTNRQMAALMESIRERASRGGPGRAKLVHQIVDAAIKLQGELVVGPRPTDSDLAAAVVEVYEETKERLGKLLIDDGNARFRDVKDVLERDGKDAEAEEKEDREKAEIIIRKSTTPPPPPKPEDLFPNTGPEAVVEEWELTETVSRIHCVQTTPEFSSDDIILMGSYRYLGHRGRLDINPAEKEFDDGTDHFYNTRGQPAPHSRVTLLGQDKFLPTFYLSSHVLIESDSWTEIAGALAAAAKALIDGPLSKAVGGAAGLTGITGAGGPGSVAGMILDGVVDLAFDGMISGAAQRAHDIVFNLVRKGGMASNIIFQAWLTGAMIRWVPRLAVGPEPRWLVRHAIGKKSWRAKPRGENPKRGVGTLHPGHFSGDDDVVLRPALWNPKDYSSQPTGRYWYMSDITVFSTVNKR